MDLLIYNLHKLIVEWISYFSVHEIKISNKCVKTRENKRKHNYRSNWNKKGGKDRLKTACV